MEDFEFSVDTDWKPWCNGSDKPAKEPATVPEGKADTMAVCRKHNKVRAMFACVRSIGEDGEPYWECKQSDECFLMPKQNGDKSTKGRYYVPQQEERVIICYACGAKNHEATECKLARCLRCFDSLEKHTGMRGMCLDRFLEGVPEWLQQQGSTADLRCVCCGEYGHADCSRPKRPRNSYCIGCGNAGHWFDECHKRGQYLQTQRDKLMFDAINASGDNVVDIGVPLPQAGPKQFGRKRQHNGRWAGDRKDRHQGGKR